jgi:hypothetical protein
MDKKIVCKECKKTFVFTISEQKFYLSKNFIEPKKCKKCRDDQYLRNSYSKLLEHKKNIMLEFKEHQKSHFALQFKPVENIKPASRDEINLLEEELIRLIRAFL